MTGDCCYIKPQVESISPWLTRWPFGREGVLHPMTIFQLGKDNWSISSPTSWADVVDPWSIGPFFTQQPSFSTQSPYQVLESI